MIVETKRFERKCEKERGSTAERIKLEEAV
jgi:hypothetical protein